MSTCKSGGLYFDHTEIARSGYTAVAEDCIHGYPKTMRGGVLGCSSICKQELDKKLARQMMRFTPQKARDDLFEAMFKERFSSKRRR